MELTMDIFVIWLNTTKKTNDHKKQFKRLIVDSF